MPSQAPETRYAKSGDVSIAYQVAGEGPFDLIWVPGFVSHVELGWEIPFAGELRRRLANFARLIIFDKRATGMSDRVAGAPSLEMRMDDVRAVMDAAGSERAALFGVSEGAPMSILFAATYPERVTALVFLGGFSRLTWAHDYPWGFTEEEYRKELDENLKLFGPREKAIDMLVELFGEGAASYADYYRQSASPGVIRALSAMNAEIDVRAVLPSIQAPTLVLHGSEDRFIPIGGARYMAERVPGARFVELEGSGHIPVGAQFERMWDEIERFLGHAWASGWWEAPEVETVLATVLFTDIVSSTARASELGDRRWRELLEQHHARIRAQLTRFRGEEIDTAGDGFFASFDGPARAIRCACAIREAMDELGLDVRAGLHTGECELMEGKVAGIAVAIGARVAAQAGPGDVLVSQTVKDLVAGSGIEFVERGPAELKGVPGEWRLYAVANS
jgi:pimeloyl-ACP methyl ester carboxylesterase/class 3 adenylate cyclase